MTLSEGMLGIQSHTAKLYAAGHPSRTEPRVAERCAPGVVPGSTSEAGQEARAHTGSCTVLVHPVSRGLRVRVASRHSDVVDNQLGKA
jgi:hypothetical protein